MNRLLHRWVFSLVVGWFGVAELNLGASDDHWAFQPVQRPRLPGVENASWPQSPIDYFILAKLESRKLLPSDRASKRTLIRRAYFDLTGLPPTYDEVRSFEENSAPEAYENFIDRLLESPRYGERWGRHWLDIARYADTKGYVFTSERRFPFSYTYRDYVIRSLNEDLPYNQFIVEQIAADKLKPGDDKGSLAALGFLTLGRRFLNNEQDIIDDRIDVVTRGFMGLTVACARCHDHKYDPVPTADYYSLYGVFASSQEPAERPLLNFDPESKAYRDFKRELEKRETAATEFRDSSHRAAIAEARKQTGEYLLAAYDSRRIESRSRQEELIRERKLAPLIAFRWIEKLQNLEERFDPVFELWKRLGALEIEGFEAEARVVIRELTDPQGTGPRINARVAEAFSGKAIVSMEEAAEVYGALFLAIEEQSSTQEGVDAEVDIRDDGLRQALYGEGAPPNIALNQASVLLDVPTGQKVRRLRKEVDELHAVHPGVPPRAMALVDKSKPVEPVIFKRGSRSNRGDRVPRQFLGLIAGEDRQPFTDGSGRLELARAIADAGNPLTSRTIVNRVWKHHFGAPLVRTPSDLGVRADRPSHPLLLDYLASWFVDNGWSLKKLHRIIMLSAVYQQSSDPNSASQELDPTNELLWRMNRQRLELEPMRDTILAVAGNLDLAMGGQPVEITKGPGSPRRTVYGFIERQNLPGMFRTFDLASPDTSSPGRFETTVPQQALYMANSPFIQEQARALEERLDRAHIADVLEDRVRFLYRTAFQREPEAGELEAAQEFIATQGQEDFVESAESVEPLSAWARYCQVLLMSNELLFVD